MIENSVIRREVSKFLAGADLNAITVKKVRLELERILCMDLSDRKPDIEEAIRLELEAPSANGGSTSKPAGKVSPGKQHQPPPAQEEKFSAKSESDDTDSSLSELEDAPRRLPAASASKAAKRKSLAKPSTSSASAQKQQRKSEKPEPASPSTSPPQKQQQQLTDEELARQLHLKENGLPSRRRRTVAATVASEKKAVGKKKPRKSGEGGFSKPCLLSPALAAVVGSDSMPRQQVVKRLWDIAKERDMFDPKNKQFVICDAEFERLFGKKRLRMFALMKYLKTHVRNVDDC